MNVGKLFIYLWQTIIVCIDWSYELNGYKFELVTIMVIDDFGSRFPCFFMFTNLKDTNIYTLMFSAINDSIGVIQPQNNKIKYNNT